MNALEIGPSPNPSAFHLAATAGWFKIDVNDRPGRTHAGRWGATPLPFPDESLDLVLASHVLEHIDWRHSVNALREVHRVLRPGGEVRIFVPDLAALVKAYLAGKPADRWHRYGPRGNVQLWFAGRMFACRDEDGGHHRACFDEPHLRWCLEQAGFVRCVRLARDMTEKRQHTSSFGMAGWKP